MTKRKILRGIGRLLSSVLLCVLGLIIISPMVYTVLRSFSLPETFNLDGFWEVFLRRPDYLQKFWNSLFLSAVVVAGQLVLSVLAAYGFSRFRFPGRNALFFTIIITMMLPYQVTLVSSYITLDKMGLVGSYAALILPGIFSSFGVFLLKQSFDSFPHELSDAARLDGAGHIKILFRILLPQNRPIAAALVVLGFIDVWNMVEQPLVLLKYSHQYPLSVFLSQLYEPRTEMLCAAGLLAAVPVFLLFMFFDKDLMEGIESGIY